jgi:hypothetical protein
MPLVDPDALAWKEPPAGKRGGGKFRSATLIAALKANPGQWAVVATAANVNGVGGQGAPFRHAGCELAARIADDGTGVLYARWPEPTPEHN